MSARSFPSTLFSVIIFFLLGLLFLQESNGQGQEQTFADAVKVWKDNECIYPDPLLYTPQDLTSSNAGVPFLQQCQVVENKPSQERTSNDVFLAQLCQSVYFVSKAICTNKNLTTFAAKELNTNVLNNALDYEHVDVCVYGTILQNKSLSKSSIKFDYFVNGCDVSCQGSLKPVCRLIVSGLCQFFKTCKVSPRMPAEAPKTTTIKPAAIPPGDSGTAPANPLGGSTNTGGNNNAGGGAAVTALPSQGGSPSLGNAGGSNPNLGQTGTVSVPVTGEGDATGTGGGSNTGAAAASTGTGTAGAGSPPITGNSVPLGEGAATGTGGGSNTGAAAASTGTGNSVPLTGGDTDTNVTPKPISTNANNISTPSPAGTGAGSGGGSPAITANNDGQSGPGSNPGSPPVGIENTQAAAATAKAVVPPVGQHELLKTPVTTTTKQPPVNSTLAANSVDVHPPQEGSPSEILGTNPAPPPVDKNQLPGSSPDNDNDNDNVLSKSTGSPIKPNSHEQPGSPFVPSTGGQDSGNTNSGSPSNVNPITGQNNPFSNGNPVDSSTARPFGTQAPNGNDFFPNQPVQPTGNVPGEEEPNGNDHQTDENYDNMEGVNPQQPAINNNDNRNSNSKNQGGFQTVDENVPSSGHFFAYFLTAVVICIAGYVIFHNKKKIMAFIVEGRGGEGGRRRNKGNVQYSKLKSNVEEVMPSLDKATTAKNFVY